VGASCQGRPARCALAGLVAALALFGSTGARADDPASQAAHLRASNTGIAAKSHRVLLELYSLQTRLGQAERRIAALEARGARLERAEAAARLQLSIARSDMAAARLQLGARLRQLYVEGDVDPLAVLLGAESLDDALSALDGLNRLAQQDKDIIAQLTRAREALRAAVARLAARQAEIRALVGQAKAARADLVRARAQQTSYLASLRRQAALNRSQIATLSAQAVASEQQSQELTSGGGSGVGGTPPGPPPKGGRQMTVSSTGYCLQGTTATGIPVGWGVVAVDPSVIPLGTRMFVPGYGEGVAADTGSAVKGAMIDLWFPTCAQALAWGRRTLTITIH
jgi:3D (Asp-Asp-Asp) domain-containing protein/peptidoglycan hydrolase CwlO-like protein